MSYENGIMLQGFEWYMTDDGQYYQWLRNEAKHLAEAGFDSIWLPPFCKATSTSDVGYGIYDIFDLGEFRQKGTIRTKYGTRPELLSAIKELHKYNVDVYADVVMNHKGGADYMERFTAVEVDPENRTKPIGEPKTIEAWTGFLFLGRKQAYSDFQWHYYHFLGVDYDNIEKKNGIFKIIGENKDWAVGVSKEKGNYDYLMYADIDHNHPEVKAEIFKWANWLVKTTGVDGFRLDALKHINDHFVRDFVTHIKATQKPNFYVFGEYWSWNEKMTNHFLYQTEYGTDILDVGLHFNMHNASNAGPEYDLRQIYNNTVVQEHPTFAVTFVDNHDSQPGQALESYVEPWFKPLAYAIILLRREGYPCVFYGDYYGIGGKNPIPGHKVMIDNLMFIRKAYAYGEQVDYLADKNLIGWLRQGDEEHTAVLAVVMSNGPEASLRMEIGVEKTGKKFRDFTGSRKEVVKVDKEGFADFPVNACSIACWVEDQE